MTPLSKWKLAKEEEERVKKFLVEQLAKIDNKVEMKEFLEVIFSENELLMVAKRMVAILLIDLGKTDVEIGKLLHVTRATAGRFRQTYKFGRGKQEVVNVVRDLKMNKELEKFLERLKEYMMTAPFGRIPRRIL